MRSDSAKEMLDTELSIEIVQRDIRAIFEQSRQSQGGPFKSQGFLNFLVDPPATAIGDNWKGSHRRVLFFRNVEAHFLISFPSKAWDRNWTFEKFCEWVAVRSAKSKINQNLAESNRRHDFGCLLQLSAVTFMVMAVGLWRSGFGSLILSGFLLIPLTIIFRSYLHNARLVKRLKP